MAEDTRQKELLDAIDDMDQNAETVCAFAGHDWHPAGGGLLICGTCMREKWDESDG